MPVAAGISAAGAIGSAGIGYAASQNAASQQAQAASNALAFQQQVYNNNSANLIPYIGTGTSANYSLASLYGLSTPGNPAGGAAATNSAWDAFTKLPAYTFPLQQGNLSLERQLNAQGKTQSGAQAKETQQFGQGLASQYLISNYVNPLMSLSGQGQQAAGSLANSSVASGNQIGGSFGNIGAANASGTVGGANALSGGLGSATNSLALYSALGKNGGGAGSLSPTYGALPSQGGAPTGFDASGLQFSYGA